MKKDFTKIKKIVCQIRYLASVLISLNLVLLASLSAVPQVDEKDFRENLTPVIIVVEGGTGPAEEVALHLSQELVMNDFAVTVGITPYLDKKVLTSSDSQVKELRNHNLYFRRRPG